MIMSEIEENSGEIEARGCCYPSHKIHRFCALILICFLNFGSYFCYDNPGALADNFKNDLKMSTTQVVMLYSIYSWPNVVLCFIGGYLIDRVFGIRLGAIIYMAILLIGSLCFAVGGFVNSYALMIVGRFIFGIGGESLAVAVNNYCVLWFKGKELNMVFGVQQAFTRIGSTVNFLVMEPVYVWVSQYYSGPPRIGMSLLLASLTCVFSLLCGLLLGWMDLRAERILNRRTEQHDTTPVKITDVRYFDVTFWLVSIVCVAYFVAIFPFIALGKIFFERKFDFSPQDANTVNSILYILSAVLSPFFGSLIDKFGRNLFWIILSIIITIISHVMLAFSFINPYVGVAFMGISYSLLACGLWPLVAFIVPEHQLGTAYGICQSIQNLGLALVTMVSGMIVDNYGYLMLEMFFIGMLFIALLAAVLIYMVDSLTHGSLNLSTKERESLLVVLEDSNILVEDDHLDEATSSMRSYGTREQAKVKYRVHSASLSGNRHP